MGAFRPRASHALAALCACAAMAVAPDASAQFGPIVRFFSGADDGVSLVWGGIRGAWSASSNAVSYVVVDQTGRAVTYAVRRGTRPMIRFANGTATTFAQTGETLTINFNRGLGTARDIGVLTVNAAGTVTYQAINGVVDGVEYAYENGAVIARNFASMRCDQVFALAFGGDVPYSTSNLGAVPADCARNFAVGLACALPGTVYDLVDMSTDWYRAVRRGMGQAPCNLVPIPPADAVCGAIRASVEPAAALARCLMKPQIRGGSVQLDGGLCRSLGDVTFGVLLDIATGGSTSESLALKVARAVKEVYSIAGDLTSVAQTVNQFCGAELQQMRPPGAAPATDYELWQHSDFTGERLVARDHMASLGAFDNRTSGVRVPRDGALAVFSGRDFKGTCDTFQQDVGGIRYLNVGNDRASSLRVGEYCPGRPRVRLFADTNFGGRSVELALDTPELDSAGFDNEASSVRVAPDVTVALYSEPGYGGTCTQVTGELVRLGATSAGNDRVSSVRIGHECEPTFATLFADTESRGDAVAIHGDIEDLSAARLQNTSSISLGTVAIGPAVEQRIFGRVVRMAPTRPIGTMALYKQPRFSGECLTVSASLARMPSGWNDSIRSIRINATCDGYQPTSAAASFVSADGRCLSVGPAPAVDVAACRARCPAGRPGVFNVPNIIRAQCLAACEPARPVIVERCDGSARQQWRAFGPLVKNSENLCLYSPPDTAAIAGSALYARPCGNDPPYFWLRDDERFVNEQGRCLDVQRGSLFRDASEVRSSHCNDTITERFASLSLGSSAPVAPAANSAELPVGDVLSCSMDAQTMDGVLCQGATEHVAITGPGLTVAFEPNVLPRRGELVLRSFNATLPARDLHDPGTDSFTLSLWFKLAAPPPAGRAQTLLSNGATTASSAGYNLALRDGSLVFRAHFNGEGGAAVDARSLSHAAPAHGVWHHLAVVIDRQGNAMRATLDGSGDGFTSEGSSGAFGARTISSVEPLSIGSAAPEPTSSASLDALRLYRRALSSQEIATLAAARR